MEKFYGWTRDLSLISNPDGWMKTQDEHGEYWYRCPEGCEHKQPACEFETIRANCTATIRGKIKEELGLPPIMFRGFTLNDRK